MSHDLTHRHDDRIRVAQILEATTGGTRRHLSYLLRYLDRKRFALSLIYSDKRDPFFHHDLETYRAMGIDLIEVPMEREIRPAQDLQRFLRLVSVLRKGRFDLVHAHSSKAGFLARVAARLAGVPAVVYSPHSFAFQYLPESPRARFYRLLEQLAARFHHRLVCVSAGEKEVAERYRIGTPDRTVVIENAIPVDEMKPSRSAEEIRRSLEIPEAAPLVGMVAQFRRQKGIRHFVDAMPLILKARPDAFFLLVGSGPLFSAVQDEIRRKGIEDRVRLVGHQERPVDFYQLMDVFVLSSLWEGMPYVIFEAMALGLPVVASDTVGNRDLVRSGETGLLVPPADSPAIAGAIVDLLEHPERRNAMGQAGREQIVRGTSMEDWVRKYEDLYLEVAGQEAASRKPSKAALL
ncbi:glycosyltransferase family 4 protein [bacterium]|nr:glycosyltransferase family 4 protein [bacterium]